MKRKKILLVEDNSDDEALILMSLRKSALAGDVVTMRDGQAALDYLFAAGAHADLPSVVFLDLNLPKLNGLEVLQRLRAEPHTKLQPVVILTSSDELKDRQRSYACGANSYVCKPVGFAEFNDAIDRLGCYWTRLNKLPRD